MTRHFANLAIVAIVSGILFSSPTVAQLLPPAKKAEHVAITQAPTLELALDDFAIVRWTTTNPGGDDEHYGVVHYGTSPTDLSQTAKSPVRLNRAHPETIFRVRIPQLKPQTTYYCWATSMGADGRNDGEKIAVTHFTTSAPGQRIVGYPRYRGGRQPRGFSAFLPPVLEGSDHLRKDFNWWRKDSHPSRTLVSG